MRLLSGAAPTLGRRNVKGFAKQSGSSAKRLRPKGKKAMQINEADVAELVDARDLKSLDGNVVRVRVPPPAPRIFGLCLVRKIGLRSARVSRAAPAKPVALPARTSIAIGEAFVHEGGFAGFDISSLREGRRRADGRRARQQCEGNDFRNSRSENHSTHSSFLHRK
jgi:hypothetical protein